MKNIHIIFVFSIFAIGCSDDDPESTGPIWKKLGLDGYTINELELNGNMLYAATDKGLFFRNVNFNDDFTLLGLPGRR